MHIMPGRHAEGVAVAVGDVSSNRPEEALKPVAKLPIAGLMSAISSPAALNDSAPETRALPGLVVPPVALADDRLEDLPTERIWPDDVLEGDPVARAAFLSESPDGRLRTMLWDCTAGRFRWTYGCDEIVHIVAGEVHVRDDRAEPFTLRTGDVAHFAPGTETIWHVPVYVRKVAVLRSRRSDIRWRVARKVRELGSS